MLSFVPTRPTGSSILTPHYLGTNFYGLKIHTLIPNCLFAVRDCEAKNEQGSQGYPGPEGEGQAGGPGQGQGQIHGGDSHRHGGLVNI